MRIKNDTNTIRRRILFVFWLWMITASLSMNAQQVWTLDKVLTVAESQSIYRTQIEANKKLAHSYWNLYQAHLKPNIIFDVRAPNFLKSSQEIVQPDGSIAFQAVRQNNSSLNLSISQVIPSTGGTLSLTSSLQRFDNFSSDLHQYNGIPFRIAMTQPLFGFNPYKWDRVIEPLRLSEANQQYVIDMEDIHLRATVEYFAVLIAQVNQQIAETSTDVNANLLNIANERFELGKISQNDLFQLELEYKNARKNLILANFQVQQATDNLFTFLGQEVSDSIVTHPPEVLSRLLLIEQEKALELAKKYRPEIIAFERQRKETERDLEQAKTDYGIQAQLFASFGYARGAQQIHEIYSDPISEQLLQLGIRVPIFDWGRKKSAMAIATSQQQLVEQQISQDQLDFDNQIRIFITQWNQLQQQLSLQKEIRDVSIQRFEISRQRFVLGDISTTDLTIAQRENNQAQRDYISTLQDYWTTYYSIRKLTGYDFVNQQAITY